MGKQITKIIDRFDGGIVNDPRDKRENTSRVVSNFDILTDPHRMIPYRDSEDGDGGSATSQKQNFAVALRTGTTYSLYALGVKSGAGTAEVLYKDLTTGSSNDLDDNAWATPSNNQSSTGATNFNLFIYYKLANLIIGARAGTNLWAFSPSGSAWSDSWQTLTYTNIAQGLVHSKDDILYIPYDNKIASYNHTGTVWNATALTVPSHFKINSICEYGGYLAVNCAPLSGIGSSRVFLWDMDATTWNEEFDWGEGKLRIIEEVEGILVGISVIGGTSFNLDDRVVFRYLSGGKARVFEQLVGELGTNPPIAKQKVNNRLHFMLAIAINGTTREGVWSVGRTSTGFSIVHERTPNNDTALVSGTLANFIYVGDFLFQAYNSSSAWAVSKTNDQNSYTAKSIYETKLLNSGDSSMNKDLVSVGIMTEPMPTAGQIVLKYMKDEETSYTTIFTNTTDNDIYHEAINIESSGATLPQFRETSFRIESTGKAVVTGIKYKYEEVNDNPSD